MRSVTTLVTRAPCGGKNLGTFNVKWVHEVHLGGVIEEEGLTSAAVPFNLRVGAVAVHWNVLCTHK